MTRWDDTNRKITHHLLRPFTELHADNRARRFPDNGIGIGGQPLPPIQASASIAARPGFAACEVKNDTAYTLTTLFSGPTDRRVEVPPGGVIFVELTPGAYKVVGSVDAPDVLPSYGDHSFDAGGTNLTFYVQ